MFITFHFKIERDVFEVSCSLGCYSLKGTLEKNAALKFACVLLVGGKLPSFQGKHELINVKSPKQSVKFRIWYRDNNNHLEPELECVSIQRADTVSDDFTVFTAPTCTDVNNEIDSEVTNSTIPISIPVLPSGTVTSSSDLLETLKSVLGVFKS